MKKHFLPFVLASLFLVIFSCSDERINGEGPVVSMDIDIDDFSSVSVALAANVIVSQEADTRLTIETHENLFDVIETVVVDGELRISTDYNINNVRTMKIYVQADDFKKLSLSGAGEITIPNCIETDLLEVKLSGSGHIELCGVIGELDVDITGSGTFDGEDLTLGSFVGYISGSGEFRASGISGVSSYVVAGSGDFRALDLPSETVNVNISGSGNVDTTVSELLDVRISGSGDVAYKGDPEVVSNIQGSGTIRKID